MRKINYPRVSIVFLLFIAVISVVTYGKTAQKNIADGVLRLHIIANSNSEEDTELKLKVRDRIIEEGICIFEKTENKEKAKAFINENLEKICEIASDEIKKQGYSYEVRAEVGEFMFPVKFYENLMLPSGRYEALRIVIGEGKGENWWCVLYPPMCALDGLTVERGQKQLENELTKEEYRIVSEKNPPAQIRFKIVDMVNSLF